MKDPIMLDNEIEGIDFKTDTIFKLFGKHFSIKALKTFAQNRSNVTTDTDPTDIRFVIILMHNNTSSEVIGLIPNGLPYSFSFTKFPTVDSNNKNLNKNILIATLNLSIIKSIVEVILESDWWLNNRKNYKENIEFAEFDKIYDIIYAQIRNLINKLYIRNEERKNIALGKSSTEMIVDEYILDSRIFLNDI